MSQFIKATGVRPPSSRPAIILDDEILPPLGGALMLVDPAPRNNPGWGSGVPVSGGTLANLAGRQASALVGGTDSPDPAFTYAGLDTAPAKIERSAKGGLHVILPATLPANTFAVMRFPQAILNYLAKRPSNDIYVSVWGRRTASGNAVDGGISAVSLGEVLDPENVLYSHLNKALPFPGTTNRLAPARRAPAGSWEALTPQPIFQNAGANKYTGTPLATPLQANAKAWGIGTASPGAMPRTAGGSASDIFYRFYMEDLTVSGRTFEEVDGLDWKLFQRDVLTSGGRYYGDTYTAPSN